MNRKYAITPARAVDTDAFLEIVRRRQQWLADQRIDQWKGYESFFPREYFEKARQEGRFYTARDENDRVCAAIVLLAADPYWQGYEHPSALYLHNLASRTDAPGAGRALLDFCTQYARERGFAVLRLDCARDNPALNEYYAGQGFAAVGQCADGDYRGTLREKTL